MGLQQPVVFFGAGPVAAASLEFLAKWATVEAVITKPKPAHHKGSFPVLDVAKHLGLPVMTVTDKKSLDELFASKPVQSQLAVLIDFGIIVSQAVIDYFPLGIINSHFSLLPEWRGADPITFAILSGQRRTGVSLMLLVAGMDEGPILATGYQEIGAQTTTPELTEQLIEVSDTLLHTSLGGYVDGTYKLIDQLKIHEQNPAYPSEPTYSRKLSKADSQLDFTKSATELEREIRAFHDWPKSRTTLAGHEVIITSAHPTATEESQEPGTVVASSDTLLIACAEGTLAVDKLKPAGKGEMDTRAFLNGYRNLL